jgi:hypothetical protein
MLYYNLQSNLVSSKLLSRFIMDSLKYRYGSFIVFDS